MKQLSQFLMDIDKQWRPFESQRQVLAIIGSGALMLQSDYERGTKDGDVLQTAGLSDAVKAQLLVMAGKGTSLHHRHRLYVDIVPGGLPFLPRRPIWHSLTDVTAQLQHFEVQALDVVDVVVSKLKRFHADDKADVSAMIERGLVSHARLVERFKAAVDVWQDGAGAEDLPRYVGNLHEVERDYLLEAESDIELPSWVG